MRVASSPAGTPSSDERTPLVVRHESDSARLRLIGSWSRKAKLAVVGACCFSLVVYASQNSSSSSTSSLGDAFAWGASMRANRFGVGGADVQMGQEIQMGHEIQALTPRASGLTNRLASVAREHESLRGTVVSLTADRGERLVASGERAAESQTHQLEVNTEGLTEELDAPRRRLDEANDVSRTETWSSHEKPTKEKEQKTASLATWSSFAKRECDETLYGTNGAGYLGCTHTTKSGVECQPWSEQHPHKHEHDSLGATSSNFCRNPDGGESIWCYTADDSSRWEYCDASDADKKNDESAVQGKEEAPDSEDVDQELTRPASSAPGPNSREVIRDLEFADAPSDAEDFAHFVEELAEAPSEGSLVIKSSVWNFVEEAAAPGPEGWADSQKNSKRNAFEDVEFESDADYDLDVSVSVEVTDPYAVAPAPGVEVTDPLAFTDATGYEALPPSYEAQRPIYEAQRPTYEAARPVYEAQRPSYEEAEGPSAEVERPIYEAERPSYEAEGPGSAEVGGQESGDDD